MAATLTPPFHVLSKPIGPICNLDCKYCFYLEKEVILICNSWLQLRQQRAPANVMKWVHMQDAALSHSRKHGRNDACPCGSGKKFKRCCGLTA